MKKKLKKRLIIVAVVLVCIWIFSGAPMDRTAEWAAYRFAGETVHIEGFNILPYPTIRELVVSDRDGEGEYPIALTRLKIIPNYWPSNGRYIRSVSANDIYLTINREEDSKLNNWGWYEKYLEPSDDESSPSWIPEEIYLRGISASFMDPVLSGVLLLGEISVEIPSLEDVIVKFSDDQVRQKGIFSAFDKDGHFFQVDEGKLTGSLRGSMLKNQWMFQQDIQSPDHMNMNLTGQLLDDHLTIDCREASVHSGILNQWPFSEIHDTATCENVTIKYFNVEMRLDEPESLKTSFSILAKQLKIGGSGTDIRMDEFEIAGSWDGTIREGNVSLLTDNDASVLAKFNRNEDDTFRIEMDTHSWEKEQVLPLLPVGARSAFESLAVESIESGFNIIMTESDFHMVADIDSFQSGKDVDAIQINLNVSGATDGSRPLIGHADLHWDDNVIQGHSFLDENDQYRFHTSYERVNPRIWLSLIGISVPETVQARINGSIKGHAESITQPITMELDLAFDEISLFDEPVSSVKLDGASIIDQDKNQTSANLIALKSEDELFSASLQNLFWDGDEKSMSGDMVTTMDLNWVSIPLGLTDWVGETNGTMSFKMVDDKFEAPIKFSSNYLGFKEWLLPYEAEVIFNGEITMDMDDSLMNLRYGSIQVGEGTSATINEFNYDVETGRAQGGVDFESDMQLIKEIGLLYDISGSFSTAFDWILEDEILNFNWDSKGSVNHAVLLEKAGTLSEGGFALKGSQVGDEITGTGLLSAQAMTASGATISNAHGKIELSDTVLKLSELKGDLFKGTINGDATIDLTNDTYPIWFDGKIQKIDLAQMTIEVQPPKTYLTGIASGTLGAEYSLEGLLGFTLIVESDENFTINRSLVEEIMQTQKLLSGVGERKARKALDKFLGNEPQRPFDSAEMYVYLVDQKIEGLAELLSAKTKNYNGLNLHIRLDIDKPALVSSLKMLEESNIENMEF
jgi:hypothetical protein